MTARERTPNKGRSPRPQRDFRAVRAGRWSLQITPQTPRGWRATGWWMLALLAPLIPFVAFARMVDDTPREVWAIAGLVPMLVVHGLIIRAMVHWMLTRADVVTDGTTGTKRS